MNKEIEEDDRGTKTSIKKCIKYHGRRKEIMGWLLHKKKNKELYNIYSTVVDDYLYKWSDKKVIATHVYSRYQKDAREKAKRFMQEIDEEV